MPSTVLRANTHVRELLERHEGFAYNYRMMCDCGGSSVLTADYFAELNQVRMQCEHCRRTIHFGRAVIALHDEHEPALDNERPAVHLVPQEHLGGLAIRHSCRPGRRAVPRSCRALSNRYQGLIEGESTKALHVGTYETAVENMLRRMHDLVEAGSQFYLHRVTLEVDPSRIKQGYRG